jgi:predicted metal-dependent HD superfamily phosphohydrolase
MNRDDLVAAYTAPGRHYHNDYRAGRAKVLGQFAARPVIFPDTVFAARYDRQARENLARELASLR